MQQKALNGFQYAEVNLYEADARHAGNAALEHAGLGEIAAWIENCCYEHAKLEKNWHFSSDSNTNKGTRRFVELQEAQAKVFAEHLLRLWTEFDSSLIPKIEMTYSRLHFHVYNAAWYFRDVQISHHKTFPEDFPLFKFYFNWQEAKEPASKKLKE